MINYIVLKPKHTQNISFVNFIADDKYLASKKIKQIQ